MAGETLEPYAVVTAVGQSRQVGSVRVTREIATDLPGEIVGGGGMVAATASVEWVDDSNGIVNPDAYAPTPRDRVEISAGTGGPSGSVSRVFTGIVDRTDGGAASRSVGSSLIDQSRLLNIPVSVPVHLAKEVTNGGTITNTGLSSTWLAHDVARQAGWSAYQFDTSTTILWASLAGTIISSSGQVPSYSGSSTWGPVSTRDGGVGVSLAPGAVFQYQLNPLTTSGGRGVEATYWVDLDDPTYSFLGFARWDASVGNWGAGWHLVSGGGGVGLYDIADGSTYDITIGPVSGWQRVSMHVTWGSAGWTVTVRVGDTISSYDYADTSATTQAGADEWRVSVNHGNNTSNAVTVAGLVVNRYTTATPQWAAHTYTPRFKVLADAADLQSWSASRLIQDQPALDILKGMAEAECAGLWVDEDGVLTWMSRTYMRSQAVAKTLTSTDSLLDYGWSDALDSQRSTTTVKHLLPAYAVRTTPNLIVWQALDDQRFKAGETSEYFAEPEANQDWWKPDLSVDWGNVTAKPTTGSWWGGQVKADSTDAVVRTATSSDATVTSTALGPQKALLKVTAGSIGSANYLDTWGTPFVRAQGRAVWTEQSYTSTIVGNYDAPALIHECGWYVQGATQRQTLADWLAEQTSGAYPTLDSIDVVPDPTIRLGQKVTIVDSHVKGWRFDGVVFRIDQSWEDGRASMSLGVRVTYFDPDFRVTLAKMDARYAGYTLASFDSSMPAGETLADFDNAPL